MKTLIHICRHYHIRVGGIHYFQYHLVNTILDLYLQVGEDSMVGLPLPQNDATPRK